MISEELHSRCFLDYFWLTWLKKIGVRTKNRSNKSFLGDKLKLLNSRRGGKKDDRCSGLSTTQDVLRERREHDNMSISLWVLLREHSSLGNLIYFNSFTRKKRQWTFDEGRGKKSERLIFESEGRQFKKNARQDFFVDHCQCVYWTRRCCLTFSNLHRLSEILTFRREEAVCLEFSPQFGCLLNLSLTGLSEADRMIEYTPIFTVTTSTAVKQTWAKTELW